MKKILLSRWFLRGLIVVAITLVSVSVAFAAAPVPPPCGKDVTIELLNPLPSDIALGETYVVNIEVTSATPFGSATTKMAPYYPAYVHSKSDRAGAGTAASLQLQIIGARSTAALPNGSSSVTAYVGLRYPSGQTCAAVYDFSVAVH